MYKFKFSAVFLKGRREHLVNKLKATTKALDRVGLPAVYRGYKANTLIPGIHAAIARIDDGTYGFCVDCEEPIEEARLLRHPHVMRCVPCQTIAEKKC